MADHEKRLLILSENFPPTVGGSARWAGKIAEHWPGPVEVLMGRADGLPRKQKTEGLVCHRTRFVFPSWGPDNLKSIWSYMTYGTKSLGVAIRHRPQWTLVGRGLPEGMAAMALRSLLRIPYAVLAHGEEIATCMSSGVLGKMLSRVYRKARLVIANSENTRQLALRCGATEDNCIVSHPGTDAERFGRDVDVESLREQLGLGQDVVVLSVGRLEWRKNHRAVVEAVGRLNNGGLAVSYIIAGSGDQRDALERQIAELSLGDKVLLLGRVEEDRLVELYHLADIFTLPGVRTQTQFEGFGIVFIEAAAAGVPSICGNAGGSAEAVVDGQTGLVVDGADVGQLTDAMETLVRDDQKRVEMGCRAKARAKAEFDWASLTESVIQEMDLRRSR